MAQRGVRAVGVVAVLAVTVVCLAWVVAGIEADAAREALAHLAWGALGPVAVALTAAWVLRSLRFGLLLAQPVRAGTMLSVVGVSFLAVNVVPFRMGELVRPYLLAEHADVPFGAGTAAVFLERLLDVTGLLALLLLATALADIPDGALVVGGVDLVAVGQRSLAALLTLGVVGAVGAAIAGGRAIGTAVRLLAPLPVLARMVDRVGTAFVEGLRALARRPARGLGAAACTAGIWCVNGAALAVMMGAFPQIQVTPDLVLLNYAGAATAVAAIPTPGFFGAYELGSTATLVLGGVDRSVAGVFGITMHLVLFAHVVVVGLACLGVQGWSLAAAVRASAARR